MIEVEYDGVLQLPAYESLIRRSMETALAMEKRSGDVCVLLTTEDGIQTLNRSYRRIDRVTDVLTFPAWEGEALLAPPDGYLGDVAICVSRAREQAEAYGHSVEREMAFLAAHGALHLLGYDHMQPEDEQKMLRRQDEIMKEMGLFR